MPGGVFKYKKNLWSTLGLGGEWGGVPRFDDLMYLHGFHWHVYSITIFNSLVYYITSGRRKVTLRFSFH
jgi:hypothetical protein